MHQRTLKKVLPKLNKTVWKMHFMVHFIGHARFLQLFNRRCHINSIIIFVFVHSVFKGTSKIKKTFWENFGNYIILMIILIYACMLIINYLINKLSIVFNV